ncbi:LacI family DNA-binding transcriptional regulator [Propionimicrobium sp. PCR01-08-3]|uniref:LacI family DNA-binding transcriptional regulator n=1 Tax=Propionimicrobium sp. PCR01-08-3 TaxID=3052086 RepID=UPI00255C3BF4|nr:LacI family DNA-binding transcriptional regulator [Propionimicrobium sp. PCR01-08-3]WIY83380.1 LacI family DNA-binding transcriptional regulator [Propionimicrobium sp. PCR01-08-3]
MTISKADSVTVADVARAAHVSKSTAARVLSDRGSASPAARKKVLDAAARLGYYPNALARAMSEGRSKMIGVVIPDISIPFFSAVVRGLTDRMRAVGLEVIIINTDNNATVEAHSLELLATKRVDGLVLAPVIPEGSDIARTLAQRGLPIVLLDRRGPGLDDLPLVALDHEDAAYAATKHLLDLGHRRIAVATQVPENATRLLDPPDPAARPSALRLRGYLSALQEAGIAADTDLVINAPYDHVAAADAVAERLAGLDATALFATDSVVTHGSYQALQRLKIVIPDELSFIGFDDQDWTTLVTPRITVLTQPMHDMGRAAADLLNQRIANPNEAQQDVLLHGEVLTRQSTTALER